MYQILTEPNICYTTIYKFNGLSQFILKISIYLHFYIPPIHFVLYFCMMGANIIMIYNDNSNIIINMYEFLQCIPEWKVKFIKNLIFSR